jgi:hypothetical protein
LSCLPALLSLLYNFFLLHTWILHWTIHNFFNLQLGGVAYKQKASFCIWLQYAAILYKYPDMKVL